VKFTVTVIPKAKTSSIEKVSPTEFKIKTPRPPEKEKANKAVIEMISNYFKVRKSMVTLISGSSSRRKKVLVEDI
jgi:uncharacterized protein YggU (UPF0235/DUF167 family)